MISARRFFWLKATICAGFVAGIILSWRLWTSARIYPLTPVLPFLKPFPFDFLLPAAIIGLLGLIVVLPRPAVPIGVAAALAFVCAMFDQSRWQPWFYQYLFMLLAMAFYARGVDACRLIVVCIYFWSGLQKINPGFAYDTFGWMLGSMSRFAHPSMAFAAPIVECLLALGLLVRRTRNIAVLMAIGMHIFILASIGPFGHNSNQVVWPWNIAMCALVVILFWRTPDFSSRDVIWGQGLLYQRGILLLFGILPVLSFADLWDSYLSFALYSGNQRSAVIYMADEVAGMMPYRLQTLIDDNDSKVQTLDVEDWSYDELDVPPYAENRIFRSVGKRVCELAMQSPRLVMIVDSRQRWYRRRQRSVYTCASLAAW